MNGLTCSIQYMSIAEVKYIGLFPTLHRFLHILFQVFHRLEQEKYVKLASFCRKICNYSD